MLGLEVRKRVNVSFDKCAKLSSGGTERGRALDPPPAKQALEASDRRERAEARSEPRVVERPGAFEDWFIGAS